MGNLRRFLEEKTLYSKEKGLLPILHSKLKQESLNLFCNKCKSNQTFNLTSAIFNQKEIFHIGRSITDPDILIDEGKSGFLHLLYFCAMCKEQQMIISIVIENKNIQKVGQFPSLDISVPKEIESLKDNRIEKLYKKGRTCENGSYGIGAFAYYRRIVELKIDEVLEKVKELFSDDKKIEYGETLKKIRQEKNAENKIKIVKEIITEDIIKGNPFKMLYQILSRGIHELSDEECLEHAKSTRKLLILLIKEIEDKEIKKDALIDAQKVIEKISLRKKET